MLVCQVGLALVKGAWWLRLITCAYLVHVFFDRAPALGGWIDWKWTPWFRGLPLWKYSVDYFPQRLVKTADLPADKNYIVGYHPHGVISLGAGAAFGTDGLDAHVLFPGITFTIMALPVFPPCIVRRWRMVA